jgi:phytoene desaturase
MRTVTGPADHVVVVGAGLGGLAAALRLAGAGRRVTLLERELTPGGRAGLLVDRGYAFDTGPTVLTMPHLIADALDSVGERLADWLELLPVEPVYRAFYPDGSQLDVHSDVDATASEIERACGPGEAAGYRRYVEFIRNLYRLEMRDFIDRNIDSPAGLLTPALARLVAVGGFRRLAPKVRQYLRDPRTVRLFSFQAMYAGVAPQDALALYAVIAYMDTVAGVFFPRGGMHAVPRALAGAAEKHGVAISYGRTVERVEVRGGRAVAVRTADGDRIPCDAVVLNPDLPVARRDLLGVPLRRRLRYSPSCFLLLAGTAATYSRIAHHNLHFGRSWGGVFREVIRDGRLMSDPSLLVTNPTRADPGLAPAGRQIYYVLAPTPNLDAALNWPAIAPAYRDEIFGVLADRGYVGLADSIETEHITTPHDWRRRGLERGTPFASAHTFAQTGPFRPANIWGENVVFVGSGTQPGVGVPMVLISGRLAAERIIGTSRRAGP